MSTAAIGGDGLKLRWPKSMTNLLPPTVEDANASSSAPLDFRYMSARNSHFPMRNIVVANGSTFVALDLTDEQLRDSSNLLYMHRRKGNQRCYIGITVLPVMKRWRYGFGYGENMLLGRAINRHGWNAFDHIVLAFANNREQLLDAEVRAIEAAGGHRTRYTYNLSPGGEVVGNIGRPIIGVHLPTGEVTAFTSGMEAAKELGFSSPDMPNAVARKQLTSLHNWWFRFADDETAKPPETWGEELRLARLIEKRGRWVVGVNLETNEEQRFRTAAVAAKALGLSYATVFGVLNGEGHSAFGWWFRYEDEACEMPRSWGTKAAREKRDRRVFAVNYKNGERRSFRNCTVADAELSLHKGAAAAVALKERVSAGGWWFTYDEAAPRPELYFASLVAKHRSKAVVAKNLQTGEETTFPSAKAASIALGVQRSSISLIVQGKTASAKGYTFRLVSKD